MSPNREDRVKKYQQRSNRRHAVARTVKDARDRLNTSSGKLSFDYELLRIYARNRISAYYIVPLLACVIATILAWWSWRGYAVLWFSYIVCSHGLALHMVHRFEAEADIQSNLDRWRRKFLATEFLHALGWAGFVLIPLTAGSLDVDVFKLSIMLVVTAITAMLSSPIPSALFVGTLPVGAAFMASFALFGGIHSYTMALFSFGAMIFFLMLGNRLYSSTTVMLSYRAEKDALIGELEQANAISDEARRRAEEANLAKSKFLATMSHELRTPLNAILGFSEVMMNEMLGPLNNESYKSYMRDIHDSGQHLLDLINEILDLSRIEADRYELNEEPVRLIHIAEDCLHLINMRAKSKGLNIIQQFEESMPKIWADERAIRQVILNLLSNAVKFTPHNGTITLSSGWTAGGGQYISVKDNGPGVSEAEIPIILESFGQGAIAQKSAEQGTGLGLPIVQALVRMHDGKFDFKSKLREGTTVTVTLPRSRVMEDMRTDDDPDEQTILTLARAG